MKNHKHSFYTTIHDTVECFDPECDFRITRERLWKILQLYIDAEHNALHEPKTDS